MRPDRREPQDAIVPSLAPVAGFFQSCPIRSDTMRCNVNADISMSTQANVQTVKDFFAAVGRGDQRGLRTLPDDGIEWIIPGADWPLAGAHRGHAGVADLLHMSSELETSFPKPPEFVA